MRRRILDVPRRHPSRPTGGQRRALAPAQNRVHSGALPTTSTAPLRRSAALALAAGAVAALVLVPGHDAHGLWSEGELGALQRAQAALGAALSGLVRGPWLPDALRTQALALTGDPEAIRLPGAIAASALVALSAGLARALGLPLRVAALAGAFALAFPLTLAQGRLALGNPVGELLAAAAALLLAAAQAAARPSRAALLALAGAATLALSVTASGLWLGAVLPLVAALLFEPVAMSMPAGTGPNDPVPTDMPRSAAPRRPLRLVLAALALSAAGVAGWLAYHQGDGYIPALAAAKDLALRERPHARGFVAALEDCGYQLYPWLPLVLLGLLQPGRARWPALWFASGLALVSGWSLVYGAQPVPLTIPAAVLAAAAFARLTAPSTPPTVRRLALVLALAGCWIFAKDARRTPSRIGAALLPPRGEQHYPAAALGAPDLLAGLAGAAGLALVLAAMSSRPGPEDPGRSRMSRALTRARGRLPTWLPVALAIAALGRQAWVYGRELLPRTSEQFSLLRALTRYEAWAEAGALPRPLGVHRVTDPGLDLYGPPPEARVALATREAVSNHLRQKAPAAALVRLSELAPLFQVARNAKFPLYVLDASNRDVLLIANVLPPGAEDQNPIRRVLFDAPPTLAHETLLRFEDFVEVIGWEWDEPIVRGREVELRVVLRALRPMPSGSKITVRLQQGRLSRVNPLAHDLVEGAYPPQHWRQGDYLLHRFRVQVPTLEVVPGPHEVVIGLRRTESANYKLTVPEGETGEHGVRVYPGQREFAVVGEVQVW